MGEIETGFNTRLNNLKSDIINIVNKSGLPVGIVYYIVKDALNDITNAYKEALVSEKNIIKESKNNEN